MEHKVVKSNFFKAKNTDKSTVVKSKDSQAENNVKKEIPVKIDSKVSYVMGEAIDFFEDNNMKTLAEGVEKIRKEEQKNHFTVSVVGEFSRGKSSFINELLKKEYLPVSNLPSTAMLTRIRHNSKEVMVVFNEKGQKVKAIPFSEDAWDGLTADNIYGKDPKGAVLMGVNCSWLEENKVELIDTPGAGDLEEGRSKLISEALLGTDGAIVTICATTPLSESEQLFIEQRLIAKKIPFLMLIVTKLDMVPLKERSTVLNYIKNRLSLTKAKDIPVFVPYDVEMPDDSFDDIIGMDKVKKQVISWISHPDRSKLATQLVQAKMDNLFEAAKDCINDKLAIIEAGAGEKEAMLAKKRDALVEAENLWEDIKLEMNGKYLECMKLFETKIGEYTDNMVERIQFEGKRSNNPQKWWNEDYPYRAKVELTNIATGMENIISRKITEDINWFSRTIKEKFKAKISVSKESVIEKEMFNISAINDSSGMSLEDLTSQREKTRIGTTALSIVGGIALNVSGLGILSLVATMGVGTGSSIISERFFRGKIEEQQNMIKEKIAEVVPQVVRDACTESEKRLKSIYDKVVLAASEEQETWIKTQQDLINNSVDQSADNKKEQVLELLEKVNSLQKKMYS